MPLQVCQLAGELHPLDPEPLLIMRFAPEALVRLTKFDIIPKVEPPQSTVRDGDAPALPYLLTSLAERVGAPFGHVRVTKKKHFNVRTTDHLRF